MCLFWCCYSEMFLAFGLCVCVLIFLIEAFWLYNILRVDQTIHPACNAYWWPPSSWAFQKEAVSWTNYSGHFSPLLNYTFSGDCQKTVTKQFLQLAPLCPSKGRIGSPVHFESTILCMCSSPAMWTEESLCLALLCTCNKLYGLFSCKYWRSLGHTEITFLA